MLVSDTNTKTNANKTKLKIYFLFTNLLTNTAFVLLAKCLHSIQIPNALIAFFSILSLASFILAILIFLNKLSSSFYFQLNEYFKNLPLAYISYFYFTKVSYQKSTDEFTHYFLLTSSIYFSLVSIFNCVLIEHFRRELKPINILFQFLFRYFNFISKSMSLILYLSTSSDETSNSNSSSNGKILTNVVSYLTLSYLVYFVWYLLKLKYSELNIVKSLFESFKMLIDFNDKYFNRNEPRKFNSINLTSVQVVLYNLVQLLVQLACAYHWYFKAIELYKTAQNKTTLLSLLTEINNRNALINLYELEEKLKVRQFELVTVIGSVVISMLSYYIYYSYYYEILPVKTMEIKNINGAISNQYINPSFNRKSTLERARLSLTVEGIEPIPTMFDKLDGFSIGTFGQSSSIGSISSFVSSQTTQIEENGKEASCSSCSSVDTDLNNSDSFTKSSYSSSASSFEPNFNRHKSMSLYHKKGMSYSDRYMFGYETSSGVMSSASSLSSIYNDLSYFKNNEPSTLWTIPSKTINKTTMTTNNLSLFNKQAVEANKQCFNDKVLVWFNRNNVNSNVINTKSLSTNIKTLDFSSSIKLNNDRVRLHAAKKSYFI